ncbi:MAG: hypothetical protein GC184_10795 [Rhizobiales bacterium]|nr:hypothetical protein [Hyphomicrobiales bacterium]
MKSFPALATALTLTLTAGLLLPSASRAGEVHEIVQKERRFQTPEITIAKGDIIRFENHDEFIHQIFTESPTMSFDSDEKRPGESLDVEFDEQGLFEVRCHIHPKMLLTVKVD